MLRTDTVADADRIERQLFAILTGKRIPAACQWRILAGSLIIASFITSSSALLFSFSRRCRIDSTLLSLLVNFNRFNSVLTSNEMVSR